MPNPFSVEQEKKRAAAPAAVSVPQELPQGKTNPQQGVGLLRPRNPRIGRAIQLLDVLTSGDDKLLAYLKEHGTQAVEVVEEATADMAEAETPEEAEDFRPDPMDELVAQMAVTMGAADASAEPEASKVSATPPAAMDLQSLKNALMAECQNTISALAIPKVAEVSKEKRNGAMGLMDDDMRAGWEKMSRSPAPELLLSTCTIEGCCIHSVTPNGGEIIHHYKPCELNTPALRLADKVLHQICAPDYVEVHGDSCVIAVDSNGSPTEYKI